MSCKFFTTYSKRFYDKLLRICEKSFLRYFARLYILLCVYVIVFRKPKLTHVYTGCPQKSGALLSNFNFEEDIKLQNCCLR